MNETEQKQKKMQLMLQQLKADFLLELPTRFDDIEQKIMQLSATDNPQELTDELLRQVHSLKGIAGTHGLQIITNICHHFEDQLQLYSDDYQDNCLKYVDLMRAAADLAQEQESPDFTALEEDLYQLRKVASDNKVLGLIVEKSKASAAMLQSILATRNIQITVLSEGIEALTHLLNQKYDFFITAKEVGALNGLALIAALRISESINRDIKSIMISSNQNNAFFPGCEPDAVVVKNLQLAQNLVIALEALLPELRI